MTWPLLALPQYRRQENPRVFAFGRIGARQTGIELYAKVPVPGKPVYARMRAGADVCRCLGTGIALLVVYHWLRDRIALFTRVLSAPFN